METRNFKDCIGVFEGGGVRGAAFAGAYKAATNAKMKFHGTVGTSAGSIIAVLIAAKFSADEIIEILKKPLSELITKADEPNTIIKKVLQKTSSLLGGSVKDIGQLQFSMGLFSSKEIENWIEKLLSDKLRITKRPVRFSDLKLPTSIIATDIQSTSFKIWSTKNTQESSVAFAVRCSCSIPLYFQPVKGENSLCVDGGLISNLPIFLVKELELPETLPVLCFRLIQDVKNSYIEPKTGYELIEQLILTMLNGITEVQINMSASRQIIDIPTGEIKSTNFKIKNEEIEKLIKNGIYTVEEFIKNEQTIFLNKIPLQYSLKGYREGLLEAAATIINSALSEILIIGGDLSWLKSINKTLLCARIRGAQVKIVCEKQDTIEYEAAIKNARAIGAQVTEVSGYKFPLKGTAIDPNESYAKLLAIEDCPNIHGHIYSCPYNLGIINLFYLNFKAYFRECIPLNPEIKPIDNKNIINSLKIGVPIYSNLNIEIKEISPNKLLPLTLFLEQLKLNRTSEIDIMIRGQGFLNAAIIRDCSWLITPPVIEKLRNGKYVIIDGAHQVWNAIDKNKDSIRVVIVDNHEHNLPADIQDWSNVTIKSENTSSNERYKNFDISLFRPIRKAFLSLLEIN